MSQRVDCKRLNCVHSKWAFFPGFICELKTVHLNERGTCTEYVRQKGKIDAYKEALKKGQESNDKNSHT